MISKPKNILVVGLGTVGSNYVKAISSLSIRINLYMYDKDINKFNRKFKNTSKIKFYRILNIEKFNKKLHLAIISTTANKRFELVKKLKKNHIKNWIIEKLLEQSVSSTNNLYNILKFDRCWVNIPRRSLLEYKFIKDNLSLNYKKNINLNVTMNGDRLITTAIHLIDLLCWLLNTKIKTIDISKLKKKWTQSKRLGFYDIGGTLIIILKNNSKIILKTGNNVKTQDIFIGNKIMKWRISEKDLKAVRSDGIKIKITMPHVSIIMKKIISDIFNGGKCSLPLLKDVIYNHNILIKFLKLHWLKSNGKKINYLPVT